MTLTYALVSEGSADRMLHAPIEWLLEQHCRVPYSGTWANPASLGDTSRAVRTRLAEVAKYYPCDLAFVHRDRDNSTVQHRIDEITQAALDSNYPTPIVCVIPVRMTEAWFLFDEAAIRRAAGNPHSRVPLHLPSHQVAQRRSDPKEIIEEALVVASELRGRKLAQFRTDISNRKALVATYIDNFDPLRRHQSFADFEADVLSTLRIKGWGPRSDDG